MTLGSLFDGIGGFPLSGTYCGITPVLASEIEAAPVSILCATGDCGNFAKENESGMTAKKRKRARR